MAIPARRARPLAGGVARGPPVATGPAARRPLPVPPRARAPHPAALPVPDLAAEGQRRVPVGAMALGARRRPGSRPLHGQRGAIRADPPAGHRLGLGGRR
eukprot:2876286-Alexandrium_andersonii.AAC.1